MCSWFVTNFSNGLLWVYTVANLDALWGALWLIVVVCNKAEEISQIGYSCVIIQVRFYQSVRPHLASRCEVNAMQQV